MLPLPLKWCMVGGTISGSAHLIFISVEKFEKNNVSLNYLDKIFELKIFVYTQDSKCIAHQLLANSLLYLAINFAGMYTKYLTDRGQRLAFIETHKAMEHKKDSEKEYQRTQKLLDSSKIPNKAHGIVVDVWGKNMNGAIFEF